MSRITTHQFRSHPFPMKPDSIPYSGVSSVYRLSPRRKCARMLPADWLRAARAHVRIFHSDLPVFSASSSLLRLPLPCLLCLRLFYFRVLR